MTHSFAWFIYFLRSHCIIFIPDGSEGLRICLQCGTLGFPSPGGKISLKERNGYLPQYSCKDFHVQWSLTDYTVWVVHDWATNTFINPEGLYCQIVLQQNFLYFIHKLILRIFYYCHVSLSSFLDFFKKFEMQTYILSISQFLRQDHDQNKLGIPWAYIVALPLIFKCLVKEDFQIYNFFFLIGPWEIDDL